MKERPIIFSAPMVRAILAGAKTQTRRLFRPQPEYRHGVLFPQGSSTGYSPDLLAGSCPYGQPCDRLWVREPFACVYGMRFVEYKADRSLSDFDQYDTPAGGRWRSPAIMPRWASRITLEIADVRVERLQDISEEDAIAEGCRPVRPEIVLDGLVARTGRSAVDEYRQLWQSIHGPCSWDANPWVWVIEFKKPEQQEQA